MDQATAKARRGGIGGSDVAAILGESTRRGAIDVWLDKMQRPEAEPFDGNNRTRWGQKLEPLIAQVIAEDWGQAAGLEVRKVGVVHHVDRPWQLGSGDRLGYLKERRGRSPVARTARLVGGGNLGQPDEGLEIKTHGYFAGKGYGEDDSEDAVPTHIRLQCDWYMSIYDIDRWNLAALIDTADCRDYVIQRDRDLEAALVEEMDRWWRRHVVGNTPPDPDGTERFERYVRERYKDHGAEIVQRQDLAEQVRAYGDLGRQLKELEQRREMVKQQIQLAIGEHAGISTDAGIVTWKRAASGGVDYKGLVGELVVQHGLTDDEQAALLRRFTRPGSRRINAKIGG